VARGAQCVAFPLKPPMTKPTTRCRLPHYYLGHLRPRFDSRMSGILPVKRNGDAAVSF